ncbi:hypothetical protein PISMIDRAFT_18689 [Pisolithus microcarpus 441]|uniref:Uncharacterized protein n=1 Tax=Pisolithus microcarpus 441 TaxID=765257 RepID=A0A0C9YXA4_9AGAM|nr:hypothetical protein PISMIDRAFT_18689 [Pisolithus microcarpus 441]
MDISPPGEDSNSDTSYEMEVLAIVLKYLQPDLVRGSAYLSSPLSRVELEDEDVGGQPLDPVVNFVVLSSEAGVIDLTGGKDLDTGVYDPMVPHLKEIIDVACNIWTFSLSMYLESDIMQDRMLANSAQQVLPYISLQFVTAAVKIWYDSDPTSTIIEGVASVLIESFF